MGLLISGIKVSGVKIRGEESFLSIPGLVLYFDARQGKTTKTSPDRVSRWNNLAPSGVNFSNEGSDLRMPRNGANYLLSEPSLTGQTTMTLYASGKFLDFLYINSSPFGYYSIENPSKAGGASLLSLSVAASVANSFFNVYLDTNNSVDNQGRIYVLRRNNGVNTAFLQSAYQNNFAEQINTYGVLRRPVTTGGWLFYFNNGQISSFNNAPTSQAVPAEGSLAKIFDVASGTSGYRIYSHFKVLYDWTGYSDAEILGFDAKVRALLEQVKLEFL